MGTFVEEGRGDKTGGTAMLIINATVHTMEGVTIPNGYVAVSGDKIARVGPMEEAPDHW